MKGHYDIILKEQEKNVDTILKSMIEEKASPDCGGFVNQEDGLVHPGRASEYIAILLPLYLNADSVYFENEKLYLKFLDILDYLKRIQRPNGTFDLIVTNFYSSPDTGFITHNLANAYRVAEKYCADEKAVGIMLQLGELIKKCGFSMMTGGFHTPNHRWVIASALMMAGNITGENSFKDMAQRYLNEGIDCNEDGEYTERSSGIYNATNDNSLIILSHEMKNDTLLDHVKRNLDMMFTYIEPDGSIFTQNSTRQDKGIGKIYPICYYPIYLYMAYKLKDGRYANMADLIIKNICNSGSSVINLLYLFMLNPGLKDFSIEKLPIPAVYEKFYEKSGIVRVRRENISFTLLENNSNFLFFQNGGLRCSMKICASFFAEAQFKARRIFRLQDGYHLEFTAYGSYRMPFKEAPSSPEWNKMNHAGRGKANELELAFHIDIKELEDGISVHMVTEGCDRVPLKVEVCFTAPCRLTGECFHLNGEPGGDIVVSSGHIAVRKEIDGISVGPGFAAHTYTAQMRGSEPKSPEDFTIYFTDYTNIDRCVNLRKL